MIKIKISKLTLVPWRTCKFGNPSPEPIWPGFHDIQRLGRFSLIKLSIWSFQKCETAGIVGSGTSFSLLAANLRIHYFTSQLAIFKSILFFLPSPPFGVRCNSTPSGATVVARCQDLATGNIRLP